VMEFVRNLEFVFQEIIFNFCLNEKNLLHLNKLHSKRHLSFSLPINLFVYYQI
jgi:hypothetical protein